MVKKNLMIGGGIVILIVINMVFLLNYYSQNEKIEFSYNISILGQKYSQEGLSEIKINENTVIIGHVFSVPSPCTKMNYVLTKEDSIINISPQVIPQEPVIDPETGEEIIRGCVAVISYDLVEINLTLDKKGYSISLYELWDSENPVLKIKV